MIFYRYLPLTAASLLKEKPSIGLKIVRTLIELSLDESIPKHLRCSILYLMAKIDRPVSSSHIRYSYTIF